MELLWQDFRDNPSVWDSFKDLGTPSQMLAPMPEKDQTDYSIGNP